MRDFKKLDIWKKAYELNIFVYLNVSPNFSKSKQYDLVSQTKRSIYSILLNIVEGTGISTEEDFTYFLNMALGSTHELEYCCLMCKDLFYIDKTLFNRIN